MIQVSTDVASALSQNSRQFDAKIYVNGSAVNCEIMSLKFHKGACGKFTVGSIFIPYVELTVNGTTTLTTNTEFELKIAVKANGSFGTYYRVGYFTPTSIENGRTQTSIYAQGRLADTNEVLFSTEPTARSLNNILTAIRNKGYTVDLKDLTIPTASIDQLIPLIGLSVRDGLGLLASCSGGYATEDSDGHFVLGRFKAYTPTALNGDKLANYPTIKGTYELTGITVVVSESLKYAIPTEQAVKNFEIKNPYFNSSMVSTFTANTIGYTFPVTELPISLGDFRYEPMDYLSFEGSNIPCFTLDFEFDGGMKTTIKSEGDLPEVVNTKTAGPFTTQLDEAYNKAVAANNLANSVNERVDEIEENGVITVINRVQWAKGTINAPVEPWADEVPALTSAYSYLWTRIATVERDPQTGEETITGTTTPQKSTLLNDIYTFVNHASNGDATVINGGSVITGTLSANKIVVGSATPLDTELTTMNYNISDAQDTADSAQTTANEAKTAATDAAKTATNFITTISGRTGICVHAANDTSNYTNINSSGLGVYIGGTLTSSFGSSTIELGKNSATTVIKMCNDQMELYHEASGTTGLLWGKGAGGIVIGAGTSAFTRYEFRPNECTLRTNNDNALIHLDTTSVYLSHRVQVGSTRGYIRLTRSSSSVTADITATSISLSGAVTASSTITASQDIKGGVLITDGNCRPSAVSATHNLGTSTYKWDEVFAKKSTINTSDRNYKHDIKDIDDKYIAMLDEIQPVQYMYNDGDRIHTGYISQQVFEAMQNNDLTDMDFAGFCRDEDETQPDGYQYALRYAEFIAILHAKINKQQEEINELKERINGL